MTKEQAIEKAKEQYSEIWDCDINHPKYEDTVEEIVTGVIRLIMQPTSDDCVSRQAVLDCLTATGLKKFDFIIDAREKVNNLPPVTPTQSWIPVSERLPKEDGEYLLFGKIDEDEENYILIGEYDSCGEQFGIWQEQFDRTTLGCLGSEFFEYSSVIAWQPLPKAYEEK